MEKNKEIVSQGKKSNKFPENKNISSPLSSSSLVAKVNMLASTSKPNKIHTGLPTISPIQNDALIYKQVIDAMSSLVSAQSINEFYMRLHDILVASLGCSFTAYGLYNEMSGCINLKLIDKNDNSYVSKILKSDTNNPIMRSFLSQSIVTQNDVGFLNLAYFHNESITILPMSSVNKCLGVMIISDILTETNRRLCSFIANYVANIIDNFMLLELANEHINTDSLTLLYNHRGFQELLEKELSIADVSKQNLSLIMLDVSNISKINRELGHAKGDEVIKLVAEKVKHNIRKSDIAGRYGGDEIAIILPNTDVEEAKYIAEYITYSLSCCFIDDVGPVKVSVGISSYPDGANTQEKLLVLAEQAVYISQAKGYKDGMSAIISSSDFNFWDDVALHSYAEVLTKRHSQIGINFEEELLSQFNSDHVKSESHLADIATSLAGAIDAKDPYTKGHSTSVSRYSEALARAINLPETEVERISLGALLHDVGKIGIPEQILKKPDRLSDEEWSVMKQHPVIGAEKVLMPNDALKDLIPIVKYHHEHVDGSGYPEKLKGDEIPLAARIVAIADTFHALISNRPYRKGLGLHVACRVLQEGAGTQWDANLVRKFIQIAPSLSGKV